MVPPPSSESARPWRVALVVAQLTAGLAELLFAAHAAVRPTLGVAVAHLLVWVALGALRAWVTPARTWKAGLATPAAILACSGALRGDLIADWAWWPALVAVPLVAVVVVRVLHDVTGRLPPTGGCARLCRDGRHLRAGPHHLRHPRGHPLPQLATDLVVPFETLMPPGPVASGGPVVLLTIDTLRS